MNEDLIHHADDNNIKFFNLGVRKGKTMVDEDAISFAQFVIDRFFGHNLTDQIIRNTLNDWRRGMDKPSMIEDIADEWYEGKRQSEEDAWRDDT